MDAKPVHDKQQKDANNNLHSNQELIKMNATTQRVTASNFSDSQPSHGTSKSMYKQENEEGNTFVVRD